MQYRIVKTTKSLDDHVITERYSVETLMDKTIECETWRTEGVFDNLDSAKVCVEGIKQKYLFDQKCVTCLTVVEEGHFE